MANKSKDVKNRPAGINDNFEIAVMDINNVVEKENRRPVLKVNGSVKIPNLSTDLQQGMSIKAYDGGKTQDIER